MSKPQGGPGFDVVTAARDAIAKHRMLDGGETVVVAVSGGPDSTCLLDVMRRLPLDLSIVVAHVDHGLHDTSEAVAARVSLAAAEAGLDVHVARAAGLEGPNLHLRAREFRYQFFETIAERVGASRIATGHTLDDRVETTLARLVHGAPPEGLAGLPPIEGSRIRPLIDVRRGETRDYCAANSLEFFDDPANDDPRFERAVVRATLIPAIEERWGEGAIRAIAGSSEHLRHDALALAGLADVLYEQLVRKGEGTLSFEVKALADVPRALRRRLLEKAVGRVRDRSGGIAAALDCLDMGKVSTARRFAVASGIEIVVGPDEVVVSRMPT